MKVIIQYYSDWTNYSGDHRYQNSFEIWSVAIIIYDFSMQEFMKGSKLLKHQN